MKKAVLKVDLHDDRGKQKALKAVSSLSGIDSIAIDMKEKKLTVTGDIDPVTVVGKLRKICHTDILTVGPAKEPEKKKDEVKKDDPAKKPADNKDDKNKKDGKNDTVVQFIKPPQQYYQPYPAVPAAYYYQHQQPYQLPYQQHQQPYQHHPAPAQTYHHYNRGSEEDPNACVIC